MKAAAFFPATRSLQVVTDLAEPQITTPTGVKLRMIDVGVCGTDREVTHLTIGYPPAGSEYLVIGHEGIGEVIETGPEVTGLKPGDLAIPTVRRPCTDPHCRGCRSGRSDFCSTGKFTERGIMGIHGFMTERIVDEAEFLNPVPAELRHAGVLVEPLTIAEKSLLQAEQIQKRLPWGLDPAQCNCVVLGAGPVALLGALALRIRGFAVAVYSLEREPNPMADVLRAVDARYFSSQECSIEQLAEALGSIDLVYEATGAARFAFDVLRSVSPNGIFLMAGIPPHRPAAPYEIEELMRSLVYGNRCICGSVNASKIAFERAVEDLTAIHHKWPDALRSLITGRFPMERFSEPILQPTGIKNIIEITP
jgi:threonine dehydrogenase-like Zn-dependent dehydrogenase